MSKKLKEISSMSGGSATFGPAGYGVVHRGEKTNNPERPLRRPKNKKKTDLKRGVPVPMETQAEASLRESIKKLIFLNKVKFYEEQTKVALQEEKLRKVIRYVLSEAVTDEEEGLDTTGQLRAKAFKDKIKTTTFENDFASLKSTMEQRRDFMTVYLTGIKIYLDALDQEYNLVKQQKSSTTMAPAPAAVPADVAAQAATAPAKRGDKKDLDEQDVAPTKAAVAPEANATPKTDTKQLQAQAVSSAVTQLKSPTADIAGREAAEKALKRDLPQIDPLYRGLSMDEITVSGRTTTDRKDFRMSLIGDKNHVGNIQIEFDRINKSFPVGSEAQVETPLLDVPPLEPEVSVVPTAQPATQPAEPAVEPEIPDELKAQL